MGRVLALLLIVLLSGCGDARPDGVDAPIVVIGVDSADWTWIDEQLDAGEMPNLQALLDRGVRSDLPSLQPPQKSPTIWTTIATGMRPSKHGVADFITHDKGITGSAMRQVPTYWEILGAMGLSQAVIGWWVTFPATAINGVLVTDYLQYGVGRDQMIDASIYPERFWEMIAPLRVNPDEMEAAEFERFVDLSVLDREPERVQRALHDLAWIHAADETYRRIARAIYEDAQANGEPIDVFTVYFRGLDMVSHRFWSAFKPGEGGARVQDWELEMCGELIPRYLQYVDELIGEIVAYADPESRFVLCSDHGFFGNRRTRQGQARGVGMHDDTGIFVIAGPGIREGQILSSEEFDVHDIAPMLITMAGFPPADDIDGDPWIDPFEPAWQEFADRLAIDAIPSYESIVPERGTVDVSDPAIEAEALERLKALGYVE